MLELTISFSVQCTLKLLWIGIAGIISFIIIYSITVFFKNTTKNFNLGFLLGYNSNPTIILQCPINPVV